MAVERITVTGQWQRPDGAAPGPAHGLIEFRLRAPIVDSNGDIIVAALTVPVQLIDGSILVVLAATDSPGTQPTGNTWRVTERIVGQEIRRYDIELHHDTPGLTVDLADVAPVEGTLIRYGIKPENDETITGSWTFIDGLVIMTAAGTWTLTLDPDGTLVTQEVV